MAMLGIFTNMVSPCFEKPAKISSIPGILPGIPSKRPGKGLILPSGPKMPWTLNFASYPSWLCTVQSSRIASAVRMPSMAADMMPPA